MEQGNNYKLMLELFRDNKKHKKNPDKPGFSITPYFL